MKKNLPVTQREVPLAEDTNILSTTDLKGAITYVNDEFIRISGFNEDELIGKNHNVVRHPDMPPAAFEHLWGTLKAGRPWMGIIKNRCKNGDHYWVSAYVTPIHHNEKITEYQSVRTKPDPACVARAEARYPHLLAGTRPLGDRLPALGARWRLPLYLVLIAAVVTIASLAAGLDLAPVLAALVPFALLGIVLAVLDSRPLAQLGAQARRLAHNPISQFVYTGRRDDFGAIEFAMRMLQAETGAAVGRVGDASKVVLDKAERLVTLVEEARAAILDQQAQTDQVATAVEEMSASVREVAQNAQHTADAAHEADGEANTGRQVVVTAGEAIAALAQGIEQAAGVIHSLEQRSDEISSVLD
ncbi:MAG: methyl-accepting chemotaxis protein, partial [Chromatiaceae bacterium]|nr:methyl-accepting chemotaxis protein [Chromatiaceae bacterium]